MDKKAYRFIKDKKRVMFYSLTYFADYYDSDGDGVASIEDNLKEIETLLKEGYVTSLFANIIGEGEDAKRRFRGIIELCKKYGATFWMICSLYRSSETTIEDYVASVQTTVDVIKSVEGGWDIFSGFYWDEPYLHVLSNDDFYEMTKALYLTYKKRIYPVFCTNILNQELIDFCKLGTERSVPRCEALKYVTDAGWDNYAYDVREEFSDNQMQIERLEALSNALGVKFNSTDDFHLYFQDEMMKKFDHPVNVWMYPCAYDRLTYTGLKSDEDYCRAQVEYFNTFLYRTSEKYKLQRNAGLCLFTYNSRSFIGLVKRLPIKIDGKMLCTEEGFEEKWYEMDAAIKRVRQAYDDEGEIEIYAGLDE
ncbi:MAG: hypothetical protein E7539_00180 [Ruminococcaceae bacterium]|nr:hypothetical protein [Oscillospiraceae bacterium]